MSGRISIHRRSDGAFITTIHAMTERSWVLNDEGKCTIQLSLTDAKNVRKYMGVRNFVYITHDTLMPWGGVIETDEEWNSDNTITFTAFTGESLLKTRTPLVGLINAASAGVLFTKLLALANEPEDLLIRAGNISLTGSDAELTLDGTDLLEAVKDLAKRRNMEFSIDPVVDAAGRMSFAANWYEKAGSVKAYTLKEGYNIQRTSNPLRVQRSVVNQLTGMGDASTDQRPTWTYIDQDSRGTYGLIQGVENYDGVVNLETVKSHTLDGLNRKKQPRRTFRVEALNVDNTFGNLGKGNTLRLAAYSFGWLGDGAVGTDTSVRIFGMRYKDETDTCELTTDEVV